MTFPTEWENKKCSKPPTRWSLRHPGIHSEIDWAPNSHGMHHHQNALVHGNGRRTALQVTQVGPQPQGKLNKHWWNWMKLVDGGTSIYQPEIQKFHWDPSVPNLRFTAYNPARLTTVDMGCFIHIVEMQQIHGWSCLKTGRNLISVMIEKNLSHSLKFIQFILLNLRSMKLGQHIPLTSYIHLHPLTSTSIHLHPLTSTYIHFFIAC